MKMVRQDIYTKTIDYISSHPDCQTRDIEIHLQNDVDPTLTRGVINYHLELLARSGCVSYEMKRSTSKRNHTKHWKINDISATPPVIKQKPVRKCPWCGSPTVYMSTLHATKCKNKACGKMTLLPPRYTMAGRERCQA